MAGENDVVALLRQLAAKGINLGDINKAIKELKTEGVIKSSGRGKAPSDDPLRLAIKDAMLALDVTTSDGAKGKLLSLVEGAADDAVSFMLTLNDKWKINFVKNVKREKKAKPDKKEEPKEFEEPTIA